MNCNIYKHIKVDCKGFIWSLLTQGSHEVYENCVFYLKVQCIPKVSILISLFHFTVILYATYCKIHTENQEILS